MFYICSSFLIFYANSGGEYRMAHENLQVETVEGAAVEAGLAAGEEDAKVMEPVWSLSPGSLFPYL